MGNEHSYYNPAELIKSQLGDINTLSYYFAKRITESKDDGYANISMHVALNRQYFIDNLKFNRCQDIPQKYFVKVDPTTIFISHRWVTPNDPDPSGDQFNLIKMDSSLINDWRKDLTVWYDFSCMPQQPRSQDDTILFKRQLYSLNDLIAQTESMSIRSGDYFNRSWCVAELIIMAYDSPDKFQVNSDFNQEQRITIMDGKALRNLGLLLMLSNLSHDKKVTFVNKVIQKLIEKTKVTNGSDKEIITDILRSFYLKEDKLTIKNYFLWLGALFKDGNLNTEIKDLDLNDEYDEIMTSIVVPKDFNRTQDILAERDKLLSYVRVKWFFTKYEDLLTELDQDWENKMEAQMEKMSMIYK